MKQALKMMLRPVCVAVVMIAAMTLADRTDVWLASSIAVYHVELNLLPDGGCAVQAFATVTKQDGGIAPGIGSKVTEVAGANRTSCLDIIQNKAPVLFQNDQNL